MPVLTPAVRARLIEGLVQEQHICGNQNFEKTRKTNRAHYYGTSQPDMVNLSWKNSTTNVTKSTQTLLWKTSQVKVEVEWKGKVEGRRRDAYYSVPPYCLWRSILFYLLRFCVWRIRDDDDDGDNNNNNNQSNLVEGGIVNRCCHLHGESSSSSSFYSL